MEQEEPQKVGFFERRWRVAKAFAKSAVDYLFSVKSWVSAAVMFGGAALLGQTGTGFGEAVADFFKVGPNSAPGSVLIGIGRAVAFGTAINMATGMFKEGRKCDECNHAVAVAQNQAHQETQNHLGQQQQVDYSTYYAPQGFVPTAGLPITRGDGHTHTPHISS